MSTTDLPLTAVLLTLAIVVAAAQAGGALFARLGQPRVVGEIVAGIALGPSLLGLLAPGAPEALVPAETRPFLSVLAQLGLVVFMLVVGLEVDARVLRSRARVIGGVALGSLALPFALGAGLGVVVHDRVVVDGAEVPFVPFLLFMGLALAVTAFPVLARILRDRGLSGTAVGSTALACAAITDVVAWLLLAVVVAMVAGGGLPAGGVLLVLAALVGVVLGVVRPVLARLRASVRTRLGIVLLCALLAAWVTESIGLHVIFGAFLAGLAVPREGRLREELMRAGELGTVLLLPAFFVVAGLGVDVTTLSSSGVLVFAAAFVLAVVGKVVGAAAPAMALGLGRPEALTLGVLMNTRGLTELVLLSVGASAGLLDTRLYTALVLTAVLTTVMTGPLLDLLARGWPGPARRATWPLRGKEGAAQRT